MVSAGPDLRKKDNKALNTKPSAHVYLKGLFSVDDYFANSAFKTVKDSIQSVKELNRLNIEELKS